MSGAQSDDGPFDIEGMEAAQRETDAALAADPSRSVADPTLPIFQWAARFSLDDELARLNAGDRNAVLGALRICANHGLPMPDWLARAFIQGYDLVLSRQTGSWDDAFGKPVPKGAHLAAMRKRRNKATAVWLEVRKLHAEGWPIDDGLFEKAGKRLGIGKTLAGEFYYAAAARLGNLTDSKELPQKSGTLRNYKRKP